MVVQDGPPHGGLPFLGRNQTQPCGSGSLEFVDWIRIRVLKNWLTRYGSGPHGIGWLHTDPGPAQLVDRMWIWVLQNWLNKNPAPAELVDRILIQVPWNCLDTGKGPAELVDRVRTLVPRNWLNGFGSGAHEISGMDTDPGPAELVDWIQIWVPRSWLTGYGSGPRRIG